jgi:cysteine rich repeat protein
MISTLKRRMPLAIAIFMVVTPAFSQAPTDAQRAAIRSECRSDYQAHCASISPGGMASLQCLQKNMSSLSSGCQGAVRAVQAPAEPKGESKAESAPAATPKAEAAPAAAKEESAPAKPATETAAPAATPKETAKPAASTTTKKPSSAQIAAIRSACRSDYQKVCAGVPTGGAPALQCLEKNKSKVSASCEKAVSAASGGAASPAAGAAATATSTTAPAAAPAAAPATVLVLRPMRPREELFVLRSACGGDVRTLCGGVTPGGGRIIQCLATQAAPLSPACKDVLGQFAAQ